jgi:hypothetical protein
MSPPPRISRRSFTFAAAAAAGIALVAGAVYEVPKFLKRRARGEHADLVNRLADPEQAAVVGRAVHLDPSQFDGPSLEDASASMLKTRLAKKSLQEIAMEDAQRIDRVVEADGWVLPLTVAALCILAAQAV